MSLRIDWNRFRLTRRKLWAAIFIWVAIAIGTTLTMYFLAATGRNDITIGGDFIAFYGAAKGTVQGAAAQIYDADFFQTLLLTLYPAREAFGLTWQYPPTYLLLIFPFALLPHALGYVTWSAATGAGYFSIMRPRIDDRLVFFAIIASPSAYAAFITGQNGFFTAALLTLAVVYPKSRPLLAGAAAGLLTVKPHLGLLLPVAYLAAGCWRAFAAAALCATALAGLSLAVFGPDVWQAFFGSLFQASEMLDQQIMPLRKMATPYSAVLYLGLSAIVAKIVYGLVTAACICIVWRVWRQVQDQEWRAAALLACVFMTAPYGFHYELIMLALPLALIAERATKTGWLSYERWMMSVAVILPMFYGYLDDLRHGVSVGFIAVMLVFVMTMRRLRRDHPGIFTLRGRDGPAPA